jgi:hypothetical protein
MTNPPLEYKVRDLFEAFVFLRRQGAAPDYALQELKRLRPVISAVEREELAGLIRQWEMTEGPRHRPNPDAKIPPLPPPQPVQAKPAAQIKCPNCNSLNPPEAAYCFACGTLLAVQGTQQLVLEDESLEAATFGKLSSLVLMVRGFEDRPIKLELDESKELIFGRTAPDSVMIPDLDLASYDGKNKGVSRVHATLRYKDNVITITDMGSANYTYLNGERVYPQEIRVIRDGDELRMGHLVVRIAFERQLKRIKRV